MATSILPNTLRFLVFLMIFILQGAILGFVVATIPVLLFEKISYFQLGVMATAALPYYLRALLAPLTANRRIPWLLESMLGTLGLGLFFGAHRIEEAIQNVDLSLVWIISFGISSYVMIQDVISVPWIKYLLPSEYAQALKTAGLNLGFSSTFIIFLILRKTSRIQEISSLRHLAVLDVKCMMKAIAGLAFLSMLGFGILWHYAFYIRVVREGPTNRTLENSSFKEQVTRHSLQPWLIFSLLQRLPFLAIEVVLPWKIVQRGVPIELLALIKIIDAIFGLTSGALVSHWFQTSQYGNLYLFAFYSQTLIAGFLIYLLFKFPLKFALPLHLSYLLLYIGLHELSLFFKNLELTSQACIHRIVTRKVQLVSKEMVIWWLDGCQEFGIFFPRILLYPLTDYLTNWICFRQNLPFLDVPCPTGKSFASISNLCTDSGGECRDVFDGFYPIAISSLALGMPLGLYFHQVLTGLCTKEKEN